MGHADESVRGLARTHRLSVRLERGSMFHRISKTRRAGLLMTVALTLTTLVGAALPAQAPARAASGAGYAHIFFIMMENEGPPQIVGNMADAPFINSLVAKYASADNYFGVTHPSLPNYLATLAQLRLDHAQRVQRYARPLSGQRQGHGHTDLRRAR